MSTDPRAWALAKARQGMAARESSITPGWDNLPEDTKKIRIGEAAEWLQAAVEAGIAPLAERPTDKHDAVWVDDDGWLWGEYQTVPSSDGDAILRLVWESDECSSKRELEEQGVQFRLIGWSQ
ncbi:hypothetical protein [Streptomyces asiaticus]|uniref:hypothetical protein n=1 Tax=Streptomyces asiaticus TaxID=114695 RepID=UPI00381CB830